MICIHLYLYLYLYCYVTILVCTFWILNCSLSETKFSIWIFYFRFVLCNSISCRRQQQCRQLIPGFSNLVSSRFSKQLGVIFVQTLVRTLVLYLYIIFVILKCGHRSSEAIFYIVGCERYEMRSRC